MGLTKVTYSMIDGASVNVLDFGADPTGSTDSYAAIQAAIDSAAEETTTMPGGITVYLPPGLYKVSDSLDLSQKQGVHLVGSGQKATEIQATANVPVILYTGDIATDKVTNASEVRSMTIRGYSNTQTNSYGIKSSWTNSNLIQDVLIFRCYIGMYFEHVWQTAVNNIRMFGSTQDACSYGVWMAETNSSYVDNAIVASNVYAQSCLQTGFRIINGQGSKFVNCEAAGAPMQYAWHIGEPTTGTFGCQWMHISNCLGDSTSDVAWLFRKGNATELSKIQLSNCWAGNGDNGFYFDNVKQIVMNGCQSNYNTKSGVVLSNSEQVVINGCNFSDNYEIGSGSHGDIVLNSSTYNIISSNNCYTNLATKSIIEENGANYNNIHGNRVYGITVAGANSIVYRNIGFLTEVNGEASMIAPSNTVTVNHGLGVTPQLSQINVTPTSGLGAANSYYIANVTSTTFQIIASSNPGTNVNFAYNIVLSTTWV